MIGRGGDQAEGIEKTNASAMMLCRRNLGRGNLARPLCQSLEWRHEG